jgi:peptide/nickel transport system ATP-binding protein
MNTEKTLLEVRHLGQQYPLPKSSFLVKATHLQALKDVSFKLKAGKSLGIVGESGSGKSTLARLVMALEKPSQGEVIFKGQKLHELSAAAMREMRRDFQMVFQDPYGSLDPRQKVLHIVSEPLHSLTHAVSGQTLGRVETQDRAASALAEVGLRSSDLDKYPHEFSGGQRQRIAIARALAVKPSLIVCDEPTSALDVSVQAQILNLLRELQDALGVSYLFVTHNIGVVAYLADRVAVMHAGEIVEIGEASQILNNPQNAYSKTLLSAVPKLNQALV